MTAAPGRRERRRTETVQEILDTAMGQLAEHGPQGLALRAVARGTGMSVQSLSHYFPTRDDLITALVTAAHDEFADAVTAARDAVPAADPRGRLIAVCHAYRGWALANPRRFQLIYGTPLADYTAPEGGATTVGPRRLGAVFRDVMFADWTERELADVGPAAGLDMPHAPAILDGLPAAATARFLQGWGQLHGLVVLEVFGHLPWLGERAGDLYATTVDQLADTVGNRWSERG